VKTPKITVTTGAVTRKRATLSNKGAYCTSPVSFLCFLNWERQSAQSCLLPTLIAQISQRNRPQLSQGILARYRE
jgi:hypothetical protein